MADDYNLGAIWAEFQNNGRDGGPVVTSPGSTGSTPPLDLDTESLRKPKPIYGRCTEAPPPSDPIVIGACLNATEAWLRNYCQQSSPPIRPAAAVDRGLVGVCSSRGGVAVGVSTANQSRGTNGMACSLCRTNGESAEVYTRHRLKDSSGRITCPVLFAYCCPLCGATGFQAHTLKYCPLQHPGATSVVKQLKTTRNSAGHRRQ